MACYYIWNNEIKFHPHGMVSVIFFDSIVTTLVPVLIANNVHKLVGLTTYHHDSTESLYLPAHSLCFLFNNLGTIYAIRGYVYCFIGMETYRLFWLLKIQKDQFMVDLHPSLGKGTAIFMVTWRHPSSTYILKHPFLSYKSKQKFAMRMPCSVQSICSILPFFTFVLW
jgi:hypothetical protein